MFRILITIFTITCCFVFSKDLGTYGHVFNIEEENFLEYLKRKMTASSDEERKNLLQEYKKHFSEPVFGIDIGYAKEYRVFYRKRTI